MYCTEGRRSVVYAGPYRVELMDSSLKTYIVEDNPTIRENLVATLEELTCISTIGFSETEDEARAWMQLHINEWELAIVDLFLKQGSGLGVLQACLGRGVDQTVVVLSNYATPEIRRRCAELGVNAVFDKSNEIEDLIEYCLALTRSKNTNLDIG